MRFQVKLTKRKKWVSNWVSRLMNLVENIVQMLNFQKFIVEMNIC